MNEPRDTKVNPFKLMIVDDDPMVIKALEKMLYKRNYLFFSAFSGESAIDSVLEIKPDLILLDIFMDGMDGYEVCRKLKNRPETRNIPVIFLTSNEKPDEIVKGFRAGAVDYILKPFNSEELIARLHTHLELKTIKEQLKLMDKKRTKFFSILTHDIKDLFIGVKGVANFLQNELEAENIDCSEVKNLTTILNNDNLVIQKLLDEIILWNSIELGRYKLENINFDVKSVVKEVVDRYGEMMRNKNIDVKILIDDGLKFSNYEKAFKDAFEIVLSNALKYSFEGGNVEISAVAEEDRYVCRIKDNGVGMEKDVRDNVFRIDTPHPKKIGTSGEKGTGIGLLICMSLIEKMHGEIQIESQKMKGTTVSFYFPFISD